MAIVVEVYEYEGSAAEAEGALEGTTDQYEQPHFVYAAESLDNLAHPAQVTEISNHFGGQ